MWILLWILVKNKTACLCCFSKFRVHISWSSTCAFYKWINLSYEDSSAWAGQQKNEGQQQDLQQTKSCLCCRAQEEAFLALMWRAAVPVTHTPSSCVESMMSAARARQWQGADWQEHTLAAPALHESRWGGFPQAIGVGVGEVIICSRSVEDCLRSLLGKVEEPQRWRNKLEMKRRPCSCLNGDTKPERSRKVFVYVEIQNCWGRQKNASWQGWLSP